MSSTLLNASRTAVPILCSIRSLWHVRGYRAEIRGDSTVDTIRHILYPANVRNNETPTGGWRLDAARALRIAIPSRQAHEIIERAWLLRERHLRKQRETERERKFTCMRKAMEELERLDPVLFKEANKPEDPRKRSEQGDAYSKSSHDIAKKIPEGRPIGLFPHEMRMQTDTPPTKTWNYDWKPPFSQSQ